MANGVTVQFFGICTHMMNTPLPGRRVVLPDARSADALANHFWFRAHPFVEPHLARLQLRKSDITTMSASGMAGFNAVAQDVDSTVIVWDLNAVTLSIPNEDPGTLAVLDSRPLWNLPQLSVLTPDIGPPSSAVTVDEIPTRAAAFFDVVTGTWSNEAFQKAFVATVHVNTLGTPVLRVGSFSRDEHITISLAPDAIVSVSNLEKNKLSDDENDFALHYLILDRFPANPGIIKTAPPPTGKEWSNIPISLQGAGGDTASCSNSTYP